MFLSHKGFRLKRDQRPIISFVALGFDKAVGPQHALGFSACQCAGKSSSYRKHTIRSGRFMIVVKA